MSDEKVPLKIIVVDDSDFSRKSVIQILDSNGYEVVGEANNAADAVSLAMNTQCDLYLLDVVMPETSGIEVAQIINNKFPDKPIIMMSSLGLEHIIIESISSGAIDFLKKPFEEKELLRAVKKIRDMLEGES